MSWKGAEKKKKRKDKSENDVYEQYGRGAARLFGVPEKEAPKAKTNEKPKGKSRNRRRKKEKSSPKEAPPPPPPPARKSVQPRREKPSSPVIPPRTPARKSPELSLNKQIRAASSRFMKTHDVEEAVEVANELNKQPKPVGYHYQRDVDLEDMYLPPPTKSDVQKVQEFTEEIGVPDAYAKTLEPSERKKVKKGKGGKKKKKKEKNEVTNEVLGMIEEALKTSKSAPYARSKLMVVGEGRAGKTCTIKALLKKTFNPNEDSTKGFDVSRVDARLWDEDDGSYLAEHLTSILTKNEPKSEESQRSPVFSLPLSSQSVKNLKRNKVEVSQEEIARYGEDLKFSESTEDPLSFSIWDFGGQKVFYTLHHLFLTDYGCYLLVFNVTLLLDEKIRENAIEYLKFWLFSKKIHAPTAPIILVGTRSDDVSNEELQTVNEILITKVLRQDKFNEIGNGGLMFFPIDNATNRGISTLRAKIEEVVRQQPYIKEEVPVSFLRSLHLFQETKKEYLTLEEAKAILQLCGLNEKTFDLALNFLSQRGLAIHFSEPNVLRKFVILQPQWMIDGITDIFFDNEEHAPPQYDNKYTRDFRKFLTERIISRDLINSIWGLKGYSKDVIEFLTGLMIKSNLICNYDFDNEDSYLVPSLFTTGFETENKDSDGDGYDGPYVVIDFSGKYDAEIVLDEGDKYVRHLPFGVFERLVCLCVEHSSKYRNSRTPSIGEQVAQLSFGVDVDFEIKQVADDNGEKLWIKVSTEDGTSFEAAKQLVKTIYAMIQGLQDDFFSKAKTVSRLAISLLLPSSEESGQVLAEYNLLIKEKERNPDLNVIVRPKRKEKTKIKLSAFKDWLLDESPDTNPIILTDPDAQFKKELEKDMQLKKMKVSKMRPLPADFKYHCFLSYKQSSAIDIVGKQFFILSNRGFKCWYDQQFDGEINLENMKKGVKESMCYVLFLSRDIFPSRFVEEEIKTAIEAKKPIIFLHHPDTGNAEYWSFGDYIANAPDIVKPLFSSIESIQLQRRYYLEQAVTEEIDKRLMDIYHASAK